MTLAKDFSLSAVIAGFITVLVGFSGAGVIVFKAAQALGATPSEIGSWIWALGVGYGAHECDIILAVQNARGHGLVYAGSGFVDSSGGRHFYAGSDWGFFNLRIAAGNLRGLPAGLSGR